MQPIWEAGIVLARKGNLHCIVAEVLWQSYCEHVASCLSGKTISATIANPKTVNTNCVPFAASFRLIKVIHTVVFFVVFDKSTMSFTLLDGYLVLVVFSFK